MGDKAPVSTDWEHATGLELQELQAAAEGKDFFDHYDFLKQPNGTKEAPVVVMRNRNVNGVITGRGALMSIFDVTSAGVRRVNSSKSLDFCSSDSPMASMSTCVSPIEIFARSNRSSAKSP